MNVAEVTHEATQFIIALAILGNAVLSWRNGRKLEKVHQSTNGLATRNEAIARKLGVLEGTAAEKANPS